MKNGVEWLKCRIGAGCYLGHNPMDKNSTLENSACYQINAQGYAFPILGGISHQSVGGFMMTSSAGGSLKHGFADVIEDIEFVDGKGQRQVATRGTDLWNAVGVSMGMFGVITHVTFRVGRSFLVQGKEENVQFADSLLGPDGEGKSKLKESLDTHEYLHVNWFPQKDVKRVMQWTGKQTLMGDIEPYHHTLENPMTVSFAAIALMTCNRIIQEANPTDYDFKLIGFLLRQFVPLKPAKEFCDLWYKTLPNDNQAPVNTIIKTDFTEIWLPLDQYQKLMDKLERCVFRGHLCTRLLALHGRVIGLSPGFE